MRCSMCAADLCCSVCTEEPRWSERQTSLRELAAVWRSTADLGEALPYSKSDERAIGYREALNGCASMLDDVIAQQQMNGQKLTEAEIENGVRAQIASIRKARAMRASAVDARVFLDAMIEALREEQRAPDPVTEHAWMHPTEPGEPDRTPQQEALIRADNARLREEIATYADTHRNDVDTMRKQADTIAALRAGENLK
jgi:hypothetical protein